jgi:hypothetical protein
MRGNANVITAMVPLANMFSYVDNLRSMSQGRATFTMLFDHYAPVIVKIADVKITGHGGSLRSTLAMISNPGRCQRPSGGCLARRAQSRLIKPAGVTKTRKFAITIVPARK